jgi:hypothetical protein
MTSKAVQETIIQWLQVKDNFLLITGAAAFGSPVVSGKKLKIKDAHAALAKYINEKHKTTLTDDEAKNKYNWLVQKFKKANTLSNTENDITKLEAICPFYRELDTLFGQRQNINPSNVMEPIIVPSVPINIPNNHINLSKRELSCGNFGHLVLIFFLI